MRLRTVEGNRTVKDFSKAVRSQGGFIEGGGRHSKFYSPDGERQVPFPNHKGDLATGTACKIIKMLIEIGFVCLALYIIL